MIYEAQDHFTDRKDAAQTVVPADQAALYERDGWEVIGYREDPGGRRVADIRKRFQPS